MRQYRAAAVKTLGNHATVLSMVVCNWYYMGMQSALVREYQRLGRDRDSAPLAYLRVRRAVRSVLEHSGMEPGHALPAERELAQTLAVSRVTVRKALAGLIDDGVLVQRQGAGTFVAARIVKPIARLSSFSEDLAERGLHPRSKFIRRARGIASKDELRVMKLAAGARVLRLQRVRYSDDEPLAIEHSVVPASVLDDPALVGDSLYAALESGGCRPQHAEQRLRAVALDAAQARLLQVPVGSAALAIERRGLLDDGRVVEYTRSWYRGDRYDFVAELHAHQDRT